MRKFATVFCFFMLGVSMAFADTVPVITTSQMPDGTMWWHYSEVISVRGTAPIKWSIIEGSLPSGLQLSEDGVISGTPRWQGIEYFTVQASNSAGYARKRLSIYISGAFGSDSSGGCNFGNISFCIVALTMVLIKTKR